MPDTDNVETKFVKQVLSVQEEEKEAKGNVTDRDDGTYATDGAPSGFTRLYHERESSPVWIRGKCHTLPVPQKGRKKRAEPSSNVENGIRQNVGRKTFTFSWQSLRLLYKHRTNQPPPQLEEPRKR